MNRTKMSSLQMTLPDFEPTIAAKTHSRITSMNRWKRYRWYKTLSPEEKERAMRIVEFARRATISKNNPMKRPEVRAKFRGENNPAKQPDVRAKISAANSGENNPSWKGGISFLSYCPAFNDRVKEHIRNLCGRTCTVCGKSILQYFRMGSKKIRLHIDHLDENKMQGCDDWEWRLTALCPSCHSKMQKQGIPQHLLLQLLLVNNKRHQTNFLFGSDNHSENKD